MFSRRHSNGICRKIFFQHTDSSQLNQQNEEEFSVFESAFVSLSNARNFTSKLNSYRIEHYIRMGSIPFSLIHFLRPVGACYQFFIRFRCFVYADGHEVSNKRRTFARVTKVHQSKAAHQHQDIQVGRDDGCCDAKNTNGKHTNQMKW